MRKDENLIHLALEDDLDPILLRYEFFDPPNQQEIKIAIQKLRNNREP